MISACVFSRTTDRHISSLELPFDLSYPVLERHVSRPNRDRPVSEISKRRSVLSSHTAAPSLARSVPRNAVPTDYTLAKRMKPRSLDLLVSVRSLDTSLDPQANAVIMQTIRDEYDARQGGMLVGLFSRCYLGPPYVDHKLDIFGNICEHFVPSDDVEFPYSQARGLVRSDAYAFVELYSDGAVVPIRTDGEPVRV